MTIGLTGSFCAGKTTVAGILRQAGVRVFSADEIYGRLLETNASLRRRLGGLWKGVVKGGRIDKKALAAMVLSRPQGIEKVSSLTHPYIIAELKKMAAKYKKKRKSAAVFEVPLLFEKGLEGLFDFTVLVWAPRYLLLRRARKRGYRYREILNILSHQMPAAEKRKLSDYVIKNNSSRKKLEKEVKKIFAEILN